MLVSNSVIKERLKVWSLEKHDRYWQERTDCRQSKLVLPSVDHGWRGRIIGFDKKRIRITTRLVTGHTNLQRHRYIMGMEDNPDCRGCGMSETAIHLLTECPTDVGPEWRYWEGHC